MIDAQDFKTRLDAARASGRPDAVAIEIQARRADEFFDYEESEIAFTKGLLSEARLLRVPIPEYPKPDEEDPWWAFSGSLGVHYLTARGVAEVREGIRREERWRRERSNQRLAWLAGLTGLIGVLIGLLSLFAKI